MRKFLLFTLIILLAAGCVPSATPAQKTTSTPSQPVEIVLADWSEDKIADTFADFLRETGVQVRYHTYESQEEVIDDIKNGKQFDVVIMDSQFIPQLIAAKLLSEINLARIPNFRNISANFRNLNFDPDNRYSVPYTWGTTGLVVRTDLAKKPVTRWADMWDPAYAGKVVNWYSTPRYTMGMALKSLGYSLNSEKETELRAALQKLLELRKQSIWLSDELSIAPELVSGQAVMGMGWAEDFWLVQKVYEDAQYVLPAEGGVLWGDNFVIPFNASNKAAAEQFINFCLRPEISARIIAGNHYMMANEAALPLLDTEITGDLVINPTNEQLKNAEILLPHSPAGQELFDKIWQEFLDAE